MTRFGRPARSGPATDFDAVLDRCISDVAAGRATVEQCLAAWPQYRARLAPLLETATAINKLPQASERPQSPQRRAEFMATIGRTPQQSPHRLGWLRLPSLPIPELVRAALAMPAARAGAFAAPVVAVAVLALMLVLTGGGGTAYASTLTVFSGEVERANSANSTGWATLPDGAQLAAGDRLRTTADGHALLTFRDGTTVGLEPATELRIDRAEFTGARSIALTQLSGRLWNHVAPALHPDARYTVATPDALVLALGTVFETAIVDGETEVSAAEGVVEVQAGAVSELVTPGQQVVAQRHTQVTVAQPDEDEPRLRVEVDAPFTASLVSPDGAATGMRPDGLVFNQITGAVTTRPGEDAQRIDLHDPQSGEYTLLLRRLAEGGGEVLVSINGEQHRVSVDDLGAAGETVRVQLTIDEQDDRVLVRAAPPQAPQASTAQDSARADEDDADADSDDRETQERDDDRDNNSDDREAQERDDGRDDDRETQERLVVTDLARERAASVAADLPERARAAQEQREERRREQQAEQERDDKREADERAADERPSTALPETLSEEDRPANDDGSGPDQAGQERPDRGREARDGQEEPDGDDRNSGDSSDEAEEPRRPSEDDARASDEGAALEELDALLGGSLGDGDRPSLERVQQALDANPTLWERLPGDVRAFLLEDYPDLVPPEPDRRPGRADPDRTGDKANPRPDRSRRPAAEPIEAGDRAEDATDDGTADGSLDRSSPDDEDRDKPEDGTDEADDEHSADGDAVSESEATPDAR